MNTNEHLNLIESSVKVSTVGDATFINKPINTCAVECIYIENHMLWGPVIRFEMTSGKIKTWAYNNERDIRDFEYEQIMARYGSNTLKL